MTSAELATLHARCFTAPRPWTEAEFAQFLADPAYFLCDTTTGFVLGRAVAGEAELLTLAVDPDHRRAGLGRQLVEAFEAAALAREANTAFLEVAADNRGAYALYLALGYTESGRRPRYYQTPQGAKIDAILMKKSLRSA